MKPSILILFSLFTLLACTKPTVEEPTPVATPTNDLFATWKLIKYQPGFGPTNNYSGEIQWVFMPNDSVSVAIQTGTNISSTLPLKNNGNYLYAIGTNQVTLNNKTYKYTIVNNQLTIEDLLGQAADGKKLTFNKVP